jgi:hypothetical protein
MPCCGKKRARARGKTQTRRAPERTERTVPQPRPEPDSPPHFQYIGKTGLTLMGPRTRKRYRFDHPGAIVAIDPKDERALQAVSVLRQVAKPAEAIRPD